jgi:VWFA-related protein
MGIPLLFCLCLAAAYSQTAPPAANPAPAPAQVQAPAQAATPSANPATPANPEEPTIKAHVDEVSLDLVVHDKHHKPVLDLKPTDMAVADNSTPVRLEGLHLVRGGAAHGHLVTLVFDQFVGPMAKQARQVSAKVLKVLPNDGYSIAVLNIGGRLRLMQPFTEDRKLVDKAIQVITASNAMELSSTLSLEINITTDKAEPARTAFSLAAEKDLIAVARTGVDTSGHNVDATDRAHAQILLNALQDAQKIAQEQHTYRTLAGLMALVKAQQRAPERKAIIYFTRNRQLDSTGKAMIKNITAAATKASVTFYTVDLDAMNDANQYDQSNAHFNAPAPYEGGPGGPNVLDPLTGRVGAPLQQEGGAPIQGVRSVGTGPIPSVGPPVWGSQQDIAVMTDFHRFGGDYAMFEGKRSPMVDLAQGSGGLYIDASNGLKHPLEQMVTDLSTYYEATYTPPFKEYDGSYRAITVKPLRKNVNIEAKSGYYALPPGAEAGLRPFETPLLKIMDGKTLPEDVKFHASVLRFGDMPDGSTSALAVEVPIHELQIKEDAHTNLYSAHASIEARIRDSKGVQLERVGEDITQRGALESLDRDQTISIGLNRHFISAPGHYVMDVAVADQFSGKTGAQRIEFDVPDTSKAGSLSDLVLVRKMDGIPSDEDDPVEPLRYENNKVTPNISGEVPANAQKVSLFLVLHPDPAAKDDPTLEMEIVRNGKAGPRTPMSLHTTAPGMPVPYLVSFGSGKLAPGKYEVKAYLNQDGKTSAQQIAFNVEGTLPANATAADPDADAAALRANQSVVSELRAPGQLTITPVTGALPPLSAADTRLLIEDARAQALGYSESLPNFMCMQVTNRSFDTTGYGRWKLRDNIVEMLRYLNKAETRTTVEVNGKSSEANRAGMKGALSAGEFGGVLRAVFSASTKADFHWKETDALNNGTVQVFTFSVDKANSMFAVTGSNDRQIFVAFHGQVYIDSATRSVRRITLIADDLPKGFPTHSTRIDVDYDYVAINDHDYLVPVSAEMRLTQGRHEAVLNTMEFRNYRRYGSNMKILGFEPVANN